MYLRGSSIAEPGKNIHWTPIGTSKIHPLVYIGGECVNCFFLYIIFEIKNKFNGFITIGPLEPIPSKGWVNVSSIQY